MVQVSISVEANKIHGFPRKMREFKIRIPKATRKMVEKFGNDTVNSAKRYAPYWRGTLRTSIRYHMVDDFTVDIVSNLRYAWYQEAGFKPHFVSLKHPLVRQWFEEHRTGGASSGPTSRGSIFVSRFKPFVTPAIMELIPKLGPVAKNEYERLMKSVLKT